MHCSARSGWHLALLCACVWLSISEKSIAEVTFTDQAGTILGGANVSSRSASLADIDGDSDLDLLIVGANATIGGVTVQAPRLYRNNLIGTGSMTYTDVTASMLPANSTFGAGWSSAWGDYNGDGRVDVFVGEANQGTASSGADRGDLLRNDGASGFTNVSDATGLADPGFHQNVAWADINNDHHLDMLIGMEGPEKHQIYLQDAAGHFTAVGAAVGFQAYYGTKAYGMAIGDTDGDGDLDVYISTCAGTDLPNNFYRNDLKETGSLHFTDIAGDGTVANPGNGTQNFKNSYDAEFVDFDNDGKLDLFTVGADSEKSHIYRNMGNNQFVDVDTITGHALLSDTGGDLNGGKAIDYDNDGDLDLFFHNNFAGNGKDIARKLYRNDGNWNFVDVTDAVGIANPVTEGSYDSPWGDIDRDGDQDLIATTNSVTPEHVFMSNASTNGNKWLYVKLFGPSWDTTGIGTTVYATMADGSLAGVTLRREANTNAGTFNQSDLPVHIGMGTSTTISDLKIVWPDGFVQHLTGVAANQYLTVHEIAGDYNGDGIVNIGDYNIWKDTYGSTTDLRANGDISGASANLIDMADFLIWKTNFGLSVFTGLPAGSGGLSFGVPEPASIWLLAAGAAALCFGFRRRTR